jgi:hypothetical protein
VSNEEELLEERIDQDRTTERCPDSASSTVTGPDLGRRQAE